MCKRLESVSDSEWDSLVAREEANTATIDLMKSQINKWAGGIAVLMVLISLIGGVIVKIGFGINDNVNQNKEFKVKSEERDKNIADVLDRVADSLKEETNARNRAVEAISARIKEEENARDLLELKLEEKTGDRFTAAKAEAQEVVLKDWVRELRDSDKQIRTLEMLQIEKEIEALKRDVANLRINSGSEKK